MCRCRAPSTEALALCDRLPQPARISVRPQGRYTEIIGYEVPDMLCDVCRREARGFGWFDARWPIDNSRRDRRLRHLCSLTCQNICHRRLGMIDPTPNEKAAVVNGGRMGGEYLDSIGKTDLETLEPDEWLTFVEVLVTGYCDHLRALAARDEEQLRKLDPGQVPF